MVLQPQQLKGAATEVALEEEAVAEEGPAKEAPAGEPEVEEDAAKEPAAEEQVWTELSEDICYKNLRFCTVNPNSHGVFFSISHHR